MSPPAALQMIRAEHSALSAVLQALTDRVVAVHRQGRPPDFALLRALLFYVDEFPERLHHVKESRMLFARLREATREGQAVLDRLDREHVRSEGRVRDLAHKLTAWELLGDSRRQAFERALEEHSAFYREHMRIEEEEVLPLAQRVLGEHDWRLLERAFGLHRDGLAGGEPEAAYAALFRTLGAALDTSAHR